MKTIIIYTSKTGYTKRYAEWLAEELAADIYPASKHSLDMLANYERIIYGGGVYATSIYGVKLITENIDKLHGKKLIVFATGATEVSQKNIDKLINYNFPMEQQKAIRFFYLQSGFHFQKLKLGDKLLMFLLRSSLKRKKDLSASEQKMLEAFDTPFDFSNKKNIQPLLEELLSSKT